MTSAAPPYHGVSFGPIDLEQQSEVRVFEISFFVTDRGAISDLCTYQATVEFFHGATDPQEGPLVKRRPPAHLDLDRRLGGVLRIILPQIRPNDAFILLGRFPTSAKAVYEARQ